MNKTEREKIVQEIEKRHLFYTTNRSRLSRILKSPIRTLFYYTLTSIAYLKPYRIKIKSLWGDTLSFYLPEGGAIFYYGFFEANLTNLFLRYIKPGDVFLDVGAHIGYYSNLCAHLLEGKGEIHSFEPTPLTYLSLVKNTKHLAVVHPNNCAVMDTEKKISFVDYGPKFSAFNTFRARSAGDLNFLEKTKHQIEINAVTLDHYCKSNNVHPTFVKIDAEGADYLVLQGMNEILSITRPLISLEVAGSKEWKSNHDNSMAILKTHTYAPFEISADGTIQRHTIQENYTYDNLLFIPEEKIEETLKTYNQLS